MAEASDVRELFRQNLIDAGCDIAFDPSFTGESGGQPRYVASPDINTEDFQGAVDFLMNEPAVTSRNGALRDNPTVENYLHEAGLRPIRLPAPYTPTARGITTADRGLEVSFCCRFWLRSGIMPLGSFYAPAGCRC